MSILTAKEYYITTFSSTHRALEAEKALEDKGLEFLLIPLPVGISASCGLGIKYFEKDYLAVQTILAGEQIEYHANYYCSKVEGKIHITQQKA